jgi:excisionase family DNA binding protein
MESETQTLTVEQAAKMLQIGRTAAWAAVKRGDLPVIRIGKSVRISRPALERLLAEAGRKPEQLR